MSLLDLSKRITSILYINLIQKLLNIKHLLLPKNYNQLLKSINYLKQLVSEPSNIIFPESFVSLAQKNFNKKNMNTKILKEDKIKKIGLNCLLAVSQGMQESPEL